MVPDKENLFLLFFLKSKKVVRQDFILFQNGSTRSHFKKVMKGKLLRKHLTIFSRTLTLAI